MIRVVHPGSRMLTFYPSRIPGPEVKKAPDPGSGSAKLFFFYFDLRGLASKIKEMRHHEKTSGIREKHMISRAFGSNSKLSRIIDSGGSAFKMTKNDLHPGLFQSQSSHN